MYKTILIPIDVSSEERIFQGNKMIAAARKLADEDTEFILLSVVEDVPTYVAAELPKGILEKSRLEAASLLKSVAKNAGLEARTEVRAGRAHSMILATAEEDKADLIVIASHHPGIKDYLLGSTAARVVRHADCSVHVVR